MNIPLRMQTIVLICKPWGAAGNRSKHLAQSLCLIRIRNMLVEEYGIAIWVDQSEKGRTAGGLIGSHYRVQASLFEFLLKIAHILKRFERFAITIPSRIVGQHVPLKDTLVQANRTCFVLKDDIFPFEIASNLLKS